VSERVLVLASSFSRHEPEASRALIAAGYEVEDGPCAGTPTEEELIELLAECQAVIAGNEPYTRRVLQALPELRVIARWGVGVDAIDLQAATDAGVVVTNTPGGVTQAVADHTLCLMLALARRLPEEMSVAASCDWHHVEGSDLWRKCLGIIGFGSIGQAVARRAGGFEMRVLACDVRPDEQAAAELGVELVELRELLAEADFVTLHANLTEESAGLIGEAELRAMKPTARFINAARGALVDQEALLRALEEGWIAGAALDTLAEEPPGPEAPILRAPNCIITPHNSSQTRETAERVNAQVCENIIEALSGERPRFVVNAAVYG